MERLIMWHKVTDFDTWKTVYDEDAVNQESRGFKEVGIRRFTLDPNTFIVEFEGEDLFPKLNEMLNDKALGEKMKAAGVEKMDFMIYPL